MAPQPIRPGAIFTDLFLVNIVHIRQVFLLKDVYKRQLPLLFSLHVGPGQFAARQAEEFFVGGPRKYLQHGRGVVLFYAPASGFRWARR